VSEPKPPAGSRAAEGEGQRSSDSRRAILMTLPPEIPAAVKRHAVQPPGVPDDTWAWSRDAAQAALASLEGSIVAVLEVEVYLMPWGHLQAVHTGRRATYFYRSGELALEFAERTRQEANGFVGAGARDELFVLHFSDQDDAESAHGSLRSGTG
jgi:hypothetical protein